MSLGRIVGRSWRAALPVGILAAGLLAVLPPTVAGATGLATYVSPTGSDVGTCAQSAPCATVDYATTQTTSGGTVHLAKGNYLQDVTVNKNVTIDGGGPTTVLEPSTPRAAGNDPDSGLPVDAIVQVTPGAKATIENLTVNGAPAQSFFNSTGCENDFVGVYHHGASGSLSEVTVNNIQLPTGLFGCQDGLGVYVDSPTGDHASVSMGHTVVSNYDKNGITCDDPGTSCVISTATVTGIGPTPLIAQNGIQAYNAAKADIANSIVTQNSYTGGGADNQATGLLILDVGTLNAANNAVSDNDVNVYLGSDGTGPAEGAWVVRQNTISRATDNVHGGGFGYGDGIQLDSDTNSRISVTGNTVTGSAENGISLLSTTGAAIGSNQVNNNHVNGIYVGGPGFFSNRFSSGNKLTTNHTYNNGHDGILSDQDSMGNTFAGNFAGGNGNFQMEDIFGRPNTWTNDSCTPKGDSNPAGLCH